MLVSLDELDRETAIAAVRALEIELFGNHAWSETSIRQELDAPARTYVFDVADERKGGTIQPDDVRGFAGYWYDGDDAEIMDVGVGKTYQRQGVAAAMMTWLVERAREQGARRILLEVSVVNEPAISLYRRFGFENIGLRKRYYQPEGIDAHVMALDLEPHVVGFQSATDTHASHPDIEHTERTEYEETT
ncbi:ribosomal protein S18-alanine N-acetyltransferase [Bifidobacterium simiiventris]|uniref:ribosomal protein S18-alanine N-acetyltransferase n=1 Tax=Bifidobacterium simiiventris TaxID=2834434 RepID=UPI001C58BFA2|nr:ribosomal protein S18-alanine N-acetyltransferase [Bifidobacterium simiiventris]MBW3077636.1 ribosomal protein S18-alanine N-acetyltransferase [Bifidobacterium simiiventris]